jgi:predicted transposase/invertase (TIGR01784 family)
MSKERYLDPKNDIVFKKIFGEHPHLLKSFLNAVLPLADDALIESLEYLAPEQLPEIPSFKKTIVDVKCKDEKGQIFIVEMQMNWTDSFKQRLYFGASQASVKMLKSGENYSYVQPVYGLGLVNSIFHEDPDDWYHHYRLVKQHKNGGEDVIKYLQLIFIEIPKFPVKRRSEKKLQILWLRFLKEISRGEQEVSEDLLAVPEIKEALNIAKESAFTADELEFYDSYWDAMAIEKTIAADALAKGREEGSAQEKLAIAKNLLALGIDFAIIAKSTGLAIELVRDLAMVKRS